MFMQIGTYISAFLARRKWCYAIEQAPDFGRLVEFLCADGVIRPGVGMGPNEPPLVVFADGDAFKANLSKEEVGPVMWRYKKEKV